MVSTVEVSVNEEGKREENKVLKTGGSSNVRYREMIRIMDTPVLLSPPGNVTMDATPSTWTHKHPSPW